MQTLKSNEARTKFTGKKSVYSRYLASNVWNLCSDYDFKSNHTRGTLLSNPFAYEYTLVCTTAKSMSTNSRGKYRTRKVIEFSTRRTISTYMSEK